MILKPMQASNGLCPAAIHLKLPRTVFQFSRTVLQFSSLQSTGILKLMQFLQKYFASNPELWWKLGMPRMIKAWIIKRGYVCAERLHLELSTLGLMCKKCCESCLHFVKISSMVARIIYKCTSI